MVQHGTACPLSPELGRASLLLPVTLLFTIEDRPGSLEAVLKIFNGHAVCLHHLESRPSRTANWVYDFMAEFEVASPEHLQSLLKDLASATTEAEVISSDPQLRRSHKGSVSKCCLNEVRATPWFPRKLADLDSFAEKTLECGTELEADHPGFTDAAYRARRAEITAIARTYRTYASAKIGNVCSGMQIPKIEYTEQERATWRAVYTKLRDMYQRYACREHCYVFPLLELNCGYSPDNIPQLEEVSRFLHDCTGFTLRPVMGLLSARDFLNGLAFRVFHSTQYLRHHSKPFYTPEPDVCHEMLGHVPLFADPDFAAFSQEIGLCSIGASDEDINRLATIYWFTVEFGLCRQGGEVKAYGAGLLSSFGELEHCLSEAPQHLPFDPSHAAVQKYPITEYQPLYYVADSFRSAQDKVRAFAANLDRPFTVRYNPYTQSIEVLDTKERLLKYANGIRADLQTLTEAIAKL